jgi:D-arginine dehydrogenase
VERYDFAVIGAGIAGASAAHELAARARVIVLERESQPGYHTTGRSAALYTETYGNAAMRALTTASKAFYLHPPAGFADGPLLMPRGTLLVAASGGLAALEATRDACARLVDNLEWWDAPRVRAQVPVFDEGQVTAGLFEPDAMDIEVHRLHQGYLRGLRARRGELRCDAPVTGLQRDGAGWRIATPAGEVAAAVVVNAAGAWADELAALAGAVPVGLVPMRRTAITFDPPAGADIHHWPAVIDVDEQWYFKPDAGRLLASPADETPSPPCDAQPDEYDIAVLVDRITTATTLAVPAIRSRWAGLRSFVADRTVVAGYDPRVPGFFWLAAQGGYGIQTAPAMGRTAAALALRDSIPPDVRDLGIEAATLAPDRPSLAPS